MSIIYRLISPSGKVYIGRHRYDDPNRRFKQHVLSWQRWVRNGRPRKRYQAKLLYAFDKYPPSEWLVEVLESCPTTELAEREIRWIAHYDSVANGYNITGGGGLLNLSLSDEHKQKQSKSRKAFWQTPEGQAQKQIFSERLKNHNPGADALRGKKAWNRGIPLTEETKRKISDKHRGIPKGPMHEETKQKLSKAKKGKYTDKQRAAAIQNGLNRVGFQQTEIQKKAVAQANQKQWIVTNPDGCRFEITNLTKFCRENHLDQSNLSRGSYRGWKARRIET